jgi:hypothetical protein
MIKKIVDYLFNALTGWVIGLFTTLVLCVVWLNIIPVMNRTGQGSGLPMIILVLMEMVSPVSIIGGFLGGLIPKEGGRKDQAIYAAFISAFLTTPVALFLFWYTGF